jgi:hypothetical protein
MFADILQVGTTVLAGAGGQYLAAIVMCDVLCAIANAQNRQCAMELFKIEIGGVILPYRVGASRKDNAFYTAVDFGKMIERTCMGKDRFLISEFGISISDLFLGYIIPKKH